MLDEAAIEFDIGLSEEEKDDLEELIKGLKQSQPDSPLGTKLEDIQKKIGFIDEHVTRLNEILLNFDNRMKTFYEIVRLTHEKSEIVNKRVEAIIGSINNGKKV